MNTKAEILAEMQRLNILEVSGSRHETWIKAFDMYNAIPGNQHMSMGCGTCYSHVRKWLKS